MDVVRLVADELREIQYANFVLEPRGSLHPDRILPVHDMLYQLAGERSIIQDGREYSLRAGDVLFLFNGHHHFARKRAAADLKCMYVHFYPLSEDVLLHLDSVPTSESQKIYLPTLIRTGDNLPIRQTFEEIVYLSFSESELQQLRARLLLSVLLVELSQFSAKSSTTVGGQIEYIRNLIERNPQKNYSISQLAEKVGLNRRTLTRNFRKITGKSIKQHEIESKMSVAMSIFRTKPTCTVKEVAHQLGFYDEFYFSHTFSRIVGVSPSHYKQEIITREREQYEEEGTG